MAQINAEAVIDAPETEDDDTSDDLGLISFFVGTVLIPFSVALLWKNEKKLVDFVRVIGAARKECR